MANSMYGKGREAFLEGLIAATSDTLALSLVTTAYTPSLSADQFYSTITGSGGVTAGPVTLTTVTGLLGTLSADNVVFTSVSGSASSYLVLFKNTGTPSSSRLIGLIDTATGLPVTPNGGNITVAWASGQVFTLCEAVKSGAYFPPPKIIVHKPTKEQAERHAQWVADQREAAEIQRRHFDRFGHGIPVLG